MASSYSSPFAALQNNPIFSGLSDVYNAFQERRAKLGLSNPGKVEDISKEVNRDVLAQQHMFSGLRAELTKPFSLSPLFQVSHQFALGERLNPYTFAALYGTNRCFAQGSIDEVGALSGRFNWRWGPDSTHVSKSQFQVGTGQGDSIQLEHEYNGADFVASLKALNPSVLEGGLSGILIGHYMQSLTPKLAVGLEAVWQRQSRLEPPVTAVSYVARYKAEDWIASAQLQAQGALNTSYWRRLSDKVQAGVDMSLSVAPANPMLGGGLQKEGVTAFGAKYDFRMSTFRAQIDSKGRLGCVLEKRVMAPLMMTFSADVDHMTQQAKVGVAIAIEAAPEMDEQEMMAASQAAPVNIPF
ncbi:translocase of outer mitochondrial membrane [Podospora pseudoanserina]|nr:translocase of outer mitochondrial membrane [Podospora pseudoanserina]